MPNDGSRAVTPTLDDCRPIKDVISTEPAFIVRVWPVTLILARFQGRPSVRQTAVPRLLRPGKQTNTWADFLGQQKSAIHKATKLHYYIG